MQKNTENDNPSTKGNRKKNKKINLHETNSN